MLLEVGEPLLGDSVGSDVLVAQREFGVFGSYYVTEELTSMASNTRQCCFGRYRVVDGRKGQVGAARGGAEADGCNTWADRAAAGRR